MFANEIAKVIDIRLKWIAPPPVPVFGFGCRRIVVHPTHFVRSTGEIGQTRSSNSEEVALYGCTVWLVP
jgi:hypothetical protein